MDKGGRRLGNDRREDSLDFFPDRRCGQERRDKNDRRSGTERRSPLGFRALAGLDRRENFNDGGV